MERRTTKRISIQLVIAVLGIISSLTACYWDNEEELYGNIPCFPSDISYSEEIEPILSLNCYGCHSEVNAPNNGDGIVLEGYAAFEAYAETDADILLGAIKHDGSAEPMPEDGRRMDLCSIEKIEKWIEEGRLNN